MIDDDRTLPVAIDTGHGRVSTLDQLADVSLAFAEIISGDGQKVYRERIDLTDTAAFGSRTLSIRPPLQGRRWVRLEVWDIAANGAFTQPVWIE
jgi:hypothetical protein